MTHVILIDCGSFHIAALERALAGHGCLIATVRLPAANGADFSLAHAVVISGGPHLFTDPETASVLAPQFAFIDTLTLPVLGICLGHQALGIRAGVSAYRGKERRQEEVIRIVADNELFHGLASEFSMKTDHCEGIFLPEGFERLAASDCYPVEAMAAKRLPHYGVQFHPEISGEPGAILIGNFLRIAGGVSVRRGRNNALP